MYRSRRNPAQTHYMTDQFCADLKALASAGIFEFEDVNMICRALGAGGVMKHLDSNSMRLTLVWGGNKTVVDFYSYGDAVKISGASLPASGSWDLVGFISDQKNGPLSISA